MRIVRGHQIYNVLNEDLLDDIKLDNEKASKRVVKGIDVTQNVDFKHTVYYLYVVHKKRQFEYFVSQFNTIQKQFLYCIESIRHIEDFSLSLLLPDVAKVDLATVPYDLIKNGQEDSVAELVCEPDKDTSDFFAPILDVVRNNYRRGDIFIEFRLKFNIEDGLSYKKTAQVVEAIFRSNGFMIDEITTLTKDDVSQRVMFDDIRSRTQNYEQGYQMSIRNVFYHLCGISGKGADPDADEFIKAYIDNDKQKADSLVQIPLELKKIIKPGDLKFISTTKVAVTMNADSRTINCHIPEKVRVEINQLLFIWYYCDKFIKQNKDLYDTVHIVVDGTTVMKNDIFDNFYGWYASITHCHRLYCNGTDFKKLNSYLLQKVYVDEVVLRDPILQSSKADADVQECQIFITSWENPDVAMTSPTHDLEIKQDEKNTFKTMLIARKK